MEIEEGKFYACPKCGLDALHIGYGYEEKEGSLVWVVYGDCSICDFTFRIEEVANVDQG